MRVRHCVSATVISIVRKVNIATASFDAAAQKAAAYLSQPDANYFGMSSAMVEGTYENVEKHIQIFNCK